MQTEEEQIEQLKSWWKENGRTVVVGLAVGLGGVLGYNSWQTHKSNQSQQASALYSEALVTSGRGEHEQVLRQVDALMDDYSGTGYAKLAAMLGARSAYTNGNSERARDLLEWAVDESSDDALKDVARLRLARLHLDADRLDEAGATLDAVGGVSFDALVSEVRGDIAFERGDKTAATREYERALAAESMPASGRTRVQLKLDQIGHLNVE